MTDLEALVRSTASELRTTNGLKLARLAGLSKSNVYRCRQPEHLLTRPIWVLVRLVDALHSHKGPLAPRRTTFPPRGKPRPAHSAKKKSS